MPSLVAPDHHILLSPGGCCVCRATRGDKGLDHRFVDMEFDYPDEFESTAAAFSAGSLGSMMDWGTGRRYLCEGCVRVAATLVGLGDVSEVADLKAEVAALQAEAEPLRHLAEAVLGVTAKPKRAAK